MQKFASANLGETLRSLRHERGLTVEALARKAQVGVRTVIAIEQGTTPNPRVDSVQRLAAALGVPVGDLFPAEPTGVAS